MVGDLYDPYSSVADSPELGGCQLWSWECITQPSSTSMCERNGRECHHRRNVVQILLRVRNYMSYKAR
jgi:hypothetical protein